MDASETWPLRREERRLEAAEVRSLRHVVDYMLQHKERKDEMRPQVEVRKPDKHILTNSWS
jgi:hypothetical protein